MDKIKDLEKQVADYAESSKADKAKIAALEAQAQASAKAAREAEHKSFCEGLMKEGKLTPAMLPQVLAFMETAAGAGEYEFSEGEKTSAFESFKGLLSSLPVQVEFSEVAAKNKAAEGRGKNAGLEFASADPARLELHQKAIELAEKEKISYEVAVHKIQKEGN